MANIDKCPACGAFRQSFAAVCPDCNYEFTDIQTSNSLQQFADKIEEYDRLIALNEPEKKGVGFWTIVAWIFFFPFMFAFFVIKKLRAKHEELKGNERLKSEAILNFPIPNSRGDLLEFAMLVENKVKPLTTFNAITASGMNTQKWNKVWLEKANHIEKKSQLALADDASGRNSVSTSCSNARNVYAKNDSLQWIMMGLLGALFILFIIFISIN